VEIVIRVVVLGVAFCLMGRLINFLRGFGSFRLPSARRSPRFMPDSLAGALIALFTVEQLVNGIRNGFEHPEPPEETAAAGAGVPSGRL